MSAHALLDLADPLIERGLPLSFPQALGAVVKLLARILETIGGLLERQLVLRVFDAAEFPLAGLKAIKNATGVTLNDVALGIIGGALLRYLTTLNLRRPDQVTGLRFSARGDRLVLDEETLRNLEVFRTFRGETGPGTLVHHVDGTLTPMGRRLLERHLAEAMTDLDELAGGRHPQVGEVGLHHRVAEPEHLTGDRADLRVGGEGAGEAAVVVGRADGLEVRVEDVREVTLLEGEDLGFEGRVVDHGLFDRHLGVGPVVLDDDVRAALTDIIGGMEQDLIDAGEGLALEPIRHTPGFEALPKALPADLPSG